MIDYSVFLMKNPLKPDEAPKAFARNQVREIWDLNKFSKHIASHHSGYSRGIVKAILADMCDCLLEQLLNGNKIKLGEFGDFCVAIGCKSAESVKKFTAENIETLRIKFTPGADFDNIRSMAEFNLVASRSGQAEALKAEKEANSLITDGESSVNDATGENGENSENGATGENGATDENSENGANEEGNV